MKNKAFFGMTAFCVLFAFPVSAAAPMIKAVKVPSEIVYEFVPDNQTNCDKSGSIHLVGAEKAAGCATASNFERIIDVDCDKKKIVFGFGYKKYLVELVNIYKPGTIDFDKILKHELTHVRLYQKTAEKFYPPVARALLMQYELSEKQGGSCSEITADVYEMFRRYIRRYHNESDRQQKFIDGDENYSYQWNQVAAKKDIQAKKGKKNVVDKAAARDLKKQVIKERGRKKTKLDEDWFDPSKIKDARSRYNAEKHSLETEKKNRQDKLIAEYNRQRNEQAARLNEITANPKDVFFPAGLMKNADKPGKEAKPEEAKYAVEKRKKTARHFDDDVFNAKHTVSSGEEENARHIPENKDDLSKVADRGGEVKDFSQFSPEEVKGLVMRLSFIEKAKKAGNDERSQTVKKKVLKNNEKRDVRAVSNETSGENGKTSAGGEVKRKNEVPERGAAYYWEKAKELFFHFIEEFGLKEKLESFFNGFVASTSNETGKGKVGE